MMIKHKASKHKAHTGALTDVDVDVRDVAHLNRKR